MYIRDVLNIIYQTLCDGPTGKSTNLSPKISEPIQPFLPPLAELSWVQICKRHLTCLNVTYCVGSVVTIQVRSVLSNA